MCDKAPQLKSASVCGACHRQLSLSLRSRPAAHKPMSPPSNKGCKAQPVKRTSAPAAKQQSTVPPAAAPAQKRAAGSAAAAPAPAATVPAAKKAKQAKPRSQSSAASKAGSNRKGQKAARAATDANDLADGRAFCARAAPVDTWLLQLRAAKRQRLMHTLVENPIAKRAEATARGQDAVTLVARDKWEAMVEKSQQLPLKMGRSATAGAGLFAAGAIAKGELVAEYVGKVCCGLDVFAWSATLRPSGS